MKRWVKPMKRLLLACHLPFGIRQLCVRGQHATLVVKVNQHATKHEVPCFPPSKLAPVPCSTPPTGPEIVIKNYKNVQNISCTRLQSKLILQCK